jgi:hypothetical protein
MPVNEEILGPISEDEKEIFDAETKKFEQELADYKAFKRHVATQASLNNTQLNWQLQDRLNKSMETHFSDIIGYWKLVSSWSDKSQNNCTTTLHGVYHRAGVFKMCSFPTDELPTCKVVNPVFEHTGWETK